MVLAERKLYTIDADVTKQNKRKLANEMKLEYCFTYKTKHL